MDTRFTLLVDKTSFVHFAAKTNQFKAEDELLSNRFGHMQFLWVVKELVFNAKAYSLSLVQLSIVMRLPLGKIKHGRDYLLARFPSTK